MYAFPTAKLVKPSTSDGSATDQYSIAAQTTSKTFWATTTAMVGTYPAAKKDSGTSQTNAAENETYVCCSTTGAQAVDGPISCNGGTSSDYLKTSSPAGGRPIPNRVFIQDNQTKSTPASVFLGASTGSNNEALAFRWNTDLLLAAQYQESFVTGTRSTTAGVQWCDKWRSEINKDPATKTTLTTKQGFGVSGLAKCTYLMVMASDDNGNHAPGFKMTKSDIGTYLLQWVEWADKASLASAMQMPATDAAAYHLGVYTATDGPYLNPQTGAIANEATQWAKLPANSYTNYNDPLSKIPNDIGNVIYYPNYSDSPFTASQTATMSI